MQSCAAEANDFAFDFDKESIEGPLCETTHDYQPLADVKDYLATSPQQPVTGLPFVLLDIAQEESIMGRESLRHVLSVCSDSLS